MDERQLHRALKNMDVPASDKNAKKRALNLAMAEFDTVQKENEKTFQGVSFLGRLMGRSNENKRKRPMTFRRKFAYGGSVLALSLAVFVVATSDINYHRGYSGSGSYGGGGGNNFGMIAHNITEPRFVPFGKLRSKDTGGQAAHQTNAVTFSVDGAVPKRARSKPQEEYRLADRSSNKPMAETESFEMDAITGAVAPVPQTAPTEA